MNDEKKTLGIVTLYDNINFGNKLQNYATIVFFEHLGFDCSTIPHFEHLARVPLKKRIIRVLMKIGIPPKKALYWRKIFSIKQKRISTIKGFSDDYLKLGDAVHFNHLPKNLCDKYDYFVTGSDQVWHNWLKSKKELFFFFLGFAKRNQRLTMAPSFGMDDIDSRFITDYKSGLQGFDFITCREESGKELIKRVTGQDASVILDPTMLIDKNEWIRILKKPTLPIPHKYVLVYYLGKRNDAIRNFINEFASSHEADVIDVMDINSDYYCIRPDEFLYLINNAELIISDSFHACVFSILFKKPFVVTDRIHSNSENMTSRLDTLLSKFDLSSRRFDRIDSNALLSVDYSKVDKIIEEEKEIAYAIYSMIE